MLCCDQLATYINLRSLCCTPETNKILYINCTSVSKNASLTDAGYLPSSQNRWFCFCQDPRICVPRKQHRKFYGHLSNASVPAKVWGMKVTPGACSLLWLRIRFHSYQAWVPPAPGMKFKTQFISLASYLEYALRTGIWLPICAFTLPAVWKTGVTHRVLERLPAPQCLPHCACRVTFTSLYVL